MTEYKSTEVLVSIIGGSFLGDVLYHPWGALIGGVVGLFIGLNFNFIKCCKRCKNFVTHLLKKLSK